MQERRDVFLCFTFASLTIIALWAVVLLLAAGKIVPGNAIAEATRLTIKEVFGSPPN
jgi:hypothetical protein